MTKVGGTIVYSTCSINPIENEAVIAEVMNLANQFSKDTLEVVDIHGHLEGFKGRRGLLSWPVLVKKDPEVDENGEVKVPENPKVEDLFHIFESFPEDLDLAHKHRLVQSHFSKGEMHNENLGVDNGMRVMAHD